MRRVVNRVNVLLFGLGCLLMMHTGTAQAQEAAKHYQKDYIQHVYDSAQGIEGSSANCILSDTEGLLWIGSYTGLFSYDSQEFRSYPIEDHAISVNALVQDEAGNLWIGTNGNGLYCYDGETFQTCPIDSEENLSYTINELCLDDDGNLWAATKNGLFFVDIHQEEKRAEDAALELHEEIRDLDLLSDGRKLLISRVGHVYVLGENHELQSWDVPGIKAGSSIRCMEQQEDTGDILLGTNGDQIIRLKADGSFIKSVNTGEIASINQITEIEGGIYWICSDSGIGLLEDGVVTPMQYPITNSVECVCRDYQGSYWFASSRQGVLQIYENEFSDLGQYLNLKETVNAMTTSGELLYVGTDKGLYAYKDNRQEKEDPLIKACAGMRIRQIFEDSSARLWVITYRQGLVRQDPDGSISHINTDSSDLTTNALRCIYELRDGSFLLGTEEGIFAVSTDGKVSRPVRDEALNRDRILSITEDEDGLIYVGTDGDGIYVIRGGEITANLTQKEGLFSNVILKLKVSEDLDGIWAVTGAGICFIDRDSQIRPVTGVKIANSLDLVHLGQDEVAVLAGNGFFRMKEKDLLEDDPDYEHYDKQLGLPIDFTANAWNIVKDGTLYMCGTDGAASLDLTKTPISRDIRVHVNRITADGKNIYHEGETAVMPERAHRLTLDVRLLNYTGDRYGVTFKLDGTDHEASYITGTDTEISYTNLIGGAYTYHFTVQDVKNGDILAQTEISLEKQLRPWEDPYVRMLVILLLLGIMALLLFITMMRRDKELKEHYRRKYMKQHREEVEKLAYMDMVTNIGNRNKYEQDKLSLDMGHLFALGTVSINHGEYLQRKYGIIYFEDLLKKTVQILRDNAKGDMEIYRVSENIFCIWFTQPLDLEIYIARIKMDFETLWLDEEDASSLAVGAVYHDRLLEEDYRSLFRRCDEMRRLDQKHEEMKFMDRKIRYMNHTDET